MNQEIPVTSENDWLRQLTEQSRFDHTLDPEPVRLELVKPELSTTLVRNEKVQVKVISNTVARRLPVIGDIFAYSESPSHDAYADAVFGVNEHMEMVQLQLLQQTAQVGADLIDTARIPILVNVPDGREIYVYADYQHVAKLFPAVPERFYQRVFHEKVEDYTQAQQRINIWYEGIRDKGFPRDAFSRATSVATLNDEERASFLVEQQNLVEVNRTLYGFWIAAVRDQDEAQTRVVAQQILQLHNVPDPTSSFVYIFS